MPTKIPPLGCAAVPLPKKKLARSGPARFGVEVTAAAFLFGAARPVTVGVALRVVAVPLACTAEDTFDNDCGRDDEPASVVCFVDLDGPAADELLDVDASFDAVEPEASADAIAGIDAMAAPTPRATADAPIHVNTRELPSAAIPNSTRLR